MEQQGPADSEAQMGFTARDHMADLDLVRLDLRDPPDQKDTCSLLICGARGGGGGGGGEPSAPWTEPPREEDSETSFTRRCHEDAGDDEDDEGDVVLMEVPTCERTHRASGELEEEEEEEEEAIPELYLLSGSDGSPAPGDQPVDYGFILAVSCLLTGISLVVVSYSVPRELRDPGGGVSARQMERLQRERARVWAHLDRCVMAGLSLLTLGGVLLVWLLLGSMWAAERMRRRAFAYSKQAAGAYGSTSRSAGD